jgi:hypothetical protein
MNFETVPMLAVDDRRALLRVDAAALASTALASVRRRWPFRPDLWLECAEDMALPSAQHPLFHTSYDWHSCVHMHWSLLRLLGQWGDALRPEQVDAIVAHFDKRFTADAVAGEMALFDRPGYRGFERPYGWAWLLQLQAELHRLAASAWAGAGGAQAALASPGRTWASARIAARCDMWRDALAPLAQRIALLLAEHLPRLDYPVRAGTHGNTAFACILALDYAHICAHPALARVIVDGARRWFGRDRRYPSLYEPGGEDFLSPGLAEALLMQRALDGCDFADWWEAFAPAPDALVQWLVPARVSDASDARIVHLHGLNLSRAWCWRELRAGLPAHLQPPVAQAIDAHWQASSRIASSGEYVATHWLASFALLAAGDGA